MWRLFVFNDLRWEVVFILLILGNCASLESLFPYWNTLIHCTFFCFFVFFLFFFWGGVGGGCTITGKFISFSVHDIRNTGQIDRFQYITTLPKRFQSLLWGNSQTSSRLRSYERSHFNDQSLASFQYM